MYTSVNRVVKKCIPIYVQKKRMDEEMQRILAVNEIVKGCHCGCPQMKQRWVSNFDLEIGNVERPIYGSRIVASRRGSVVSTGRKIVNIALHVLHTPALIPHQFVK